MSKVLILGFKTYSFENEKKERVEGAKVTYISENKSSNMNETGYMPLQSSLNLEVVHASIKDVPGLYDVKYDMVPGRNNKPTLAITGFDFIKPVLLDNLFK